jgi:hypothetical protein
MGGGGGPGGPQLEGTFWNTELSHQVGCVTLFTCACYNCYNASLNLVHTCRVRPMALLGHVAG